MEMSYSYGLDRSREAPCKNVRMIAPEIYEMDCPECEGTGEWAMFHPEPQLFPDGMPCVCCKGTGRVSC